MTTPQNKRATIDTARYPGEINASSVYTLLELQRRLKLSKGAIRTARRQGLTLRRIGRRSYVLGSDVILFLTDHAKVVPTNHIIPD